VTNHVKIYFAHFGYGEQHLPACEVCGKVPAVDCHHIHGRGKGKDVIENLMALCRKCHIKAHDGTFDKKEMQTMHNYKLAGRPQIFIK